MITIIAAVVGLLTLGCLIGELVWRCMTRQSRFTPGRRTRGFARWWARCTRWTRNRHAGPRRPAVQVSHGEALITPEDIRALNAKFLRDGAAAWRPR